MKTTPDIRALEHGEIRLISLKRGSTAKNLRYISKRVNLDRPPAYQAASYCWGAPVRDSLLETITIDGLLKKVRPTLYSFLAEMAVSSSGILIWIDSICINQNNVAERNQQVSIMADIYRSAESVYVWLGRGDEDTSYVIEHMQDYTPETKFVAKTFSECVEKLFTHPYWMRRWVIQEFALGKKLVIACGTDRITWDGVMDRVATKIDTRVLPEDSTALQTFRKFEDVRSAGQRNDLTLIQLMSVFQRSKCVDPRDKAFALRGIAIDGEQLAVKYDESFGDQYFRILSLIPTEWIFPVMTGYRWPHQAAKILFMAMELTENDLLCSLTDHTDDSLFTVFEYVGTVVKVEDCSQAQDQEGADVYGAFSPYTRKVRIQGVTIRYLYSRTTFEVGDVVYTLQSTSQSPKGLYIALPSDRTHRFILGLLLDEPHSKATAYWQNIQLTEQRMRNIEEFLVYGVVRCNRNVSAKSSCRVLCHINRAVFVLLWLLDIGQIQRLFGHKPRLYNLEAETKSRCNCLQGPINTSRLSEQHKASPSYNLEIMPSFPTSENDDQWKAASMQPWSPSVSSSLFQDHRPHGNLWPNPDAINFRRYTTQLCHAAREGYIASTTYLLSKLAVSTSTRRDAGQRTLPLIYGDDYPGAKEPAFYTNKVDLNWTDDDGRTALSLVAASGHDTVVKVLLKNDKVKPDDKDRSGYTPLWYAVKNGHETVVKLLLERNDVVADLKQRCNQTPLSWAAENGHDAVVKLLLERKDVLANSKDASGYTALSWAAENGHEAVVKLLLKRKDVVANSINNCGQTPLSLAADNGQEAVVKLLLERKDVVAILKDDYGQTPLSLAAKNGHEAVVKLLLKRKDVVVNSTDKGGQTPLSLAAGNGQDEVVKLLLKRKDVVANSINNCGQTPLSWAAENGHEAVMKLLLKQKDVVANSKDASGYTALSWAAENGHDAVVKLLLERKDVRVNSKDASGYTPLWFAVKNEHEVVVNLLLERKDVVLNSRDKSGQTPLSWAAQNGQEAVVKLLLKRNGFVLNSKDASGYTPLWYAIQNEHWAVVKLLLERKDIVLNKREIWFMLWFAASSRQEAVMKLLLKRKDVVLNSRDKSGQTLLSWAAQNGQEAVVKLLLKRKDVVVNSTDNRGQTPLSLAAENGHDAVVKLLRKRKYVVVDSEDNGGQTPLLKRRRTGTS